MEYFVITIVVIILCLQIFFFVKNLNRMIQFSNIFSKEATWSLRKNTSTDLVNGVLGKGNKIFDSIKNSINKYLGNNSGSVIDFGLLKDAVDRHCDSIENEIAAQTPIPLYWGLAGTMAGVILGLGELLSSDAILTLMGSGTGEIDANARNAAKGIDALLSGVAWAMVASICGIILTTLNSILFKRYKRKEENGKNSFLAWMQSELLPELPSDTSEALNKLVVNLNKFNKTFASNTKDLGNALKEVNESYAIQAQVIKAVHDMDVMKMANANVRVLQELQACTDKLEQFNEYLLDIEGYTDAIHRFEEQFGEQADRYKVLEDIRDFFNRHKDAVAKTTANADKTLKEALKNISESTKENVEGMHNDFVSQSEEFKNILRHEKEAFEEFIRQMRAQFSAQLSQMPHMAKQLEEISAIPSRLDKLIERIEKSNSHLATDVSSTMKQAIQTIKNTSQPVYSDNSDENAINSVPGWMKWIGLCALVIIAIACAFNVVVYLFPNAIPVYGQTPKTIESTGTSGEMESASESTTQIEIAKIDSVGLNVNKKDIGNQNTTQQQ